MLLDEGMTLEDFRRTGIPVKAFCNRCDLDYPIDVAALTEKVGPQFILWNRRSRCKQEGCSGWNRFHSARGGVFLPLWDERRAMEWMRRDRLAEG